MKRAALAEACAASGFWKLTSKVFPENAASRQLCRAAGFREVGTHHRHAQLDGAWRDVVVVERLLSAGGRPATAPAAADRAGAGG